MNNVEPPAEKSSNFTNHELMELVLSQKLEMDKGNKIAKEFDINNEVLDILKVIDDKNMEDYGREANLPPPNLNSPYRWKKHKSRNQKIHQTLRRMCITVRRKPNRSSVQTNYQKKNRRN